MYMDASKKKSLEYEYDAHDNTEEFMTLMDLTDQTSSKEVTIIKEMKKGPWTVEEDSKLDKYIKIYGQGRWNSLAQCAGLKRTGKSCRLRWLNYLRPGVRHGNLTLEEQFLILQLHCRFGNRWSMIAKHLPGRTDNEIKNYWRTRIQKQAKQLKCDVNSKEFRDIIYYRLLPRLFEQIQASSSSYSSATSSSMVERNSTATTISFNHEYNYSRTDHMAVVTTPSPTVSTISPTSESSAAIALPHLLQGQDFPASDFTINCDEVFLGYNWPGSFGDISPIMGLTSISSSAAGSCEQDGPFDCPALDNYCGNTCLNDEYDDDELVKVFGSCGNRINYDDELTKILGSHIL